ncbi:hypothetical protein LPJ75_007304, partial [Coemansia sp. RSA 2598]
SDAVAITTFIYHPYSEGYRQSSDEEPSLATNENYDTAQSRKRPYSESIEYIDYFQRRPHMQSEPLADGAYSGDRRERWQTTIYEEAPEYRERLEPGSRGSAMREETGSNNIYQQGNWVEGEEQQQQQQAAAATTAVHRHQSRDPDSLQPYLLTADSQQTHAKLADSIADSIQREELQRRTTLDGIREELADSGIIPDVLPQTFQPEFNITLRFDNQPVQMGEVLTLNDTRHEPIIEFDSQPEQTFSVAIVDPDAPSMARHGYRSFRHFLVSNLDTKEDTVSNILTAYEPPQPAFGTGMHRYAVVVLKQLGGRFNVTDSDIPPSRVRFNV